MSGPVTPERGYELNRLNWDERVDAHFESPMYQAHVQALTNGGVCLDQVHIDEMGDVGRLYAAKTTPHMFVINKEGILVYDGAIDSKASARIGDIKTAENYIAKTLDSLLNAKKIEPEKTSPYGCSVKYK